MTILSRYNAIHKQAPDYILLVRFGDNYAAFGDDARCIANVASCRIGNGCVLVRAVELDEVLKALIMDSKKVACLDNDIRAVA